MTWLVVVSHTQPDSLFFRVEIYFFLISDYFSINYGAPSLEGWRGVVVRSYIHDASKQLRGESREWDDGLRTPPLSLSLCLFVHAVADRGFTNRWSSGFHLGRDTCTGAILVPLFRPGFIYATG